MDAAVIDRILGYAQDGMSPARIASTIGVSEDEVRRHTIGVLAPSSNATTKAPSAAARHVGRPSTVEDEAWRLCHEEGMFWADAARQMGSTTWVVSNAVKRRAAKLGIDPAPGRMPREVADRRMREARGLPAEKPAAPVRRSHRRPSATPPVVITSESAERLELHPGGSDVLVDLPSDDHATVEPTELPAPLDPAHVEPTLVEHRSNIGLESPPPVELHERSESSDVAWSATVGELGPMLDRFEDGRTRGLMEAIAVVAGTQTSGVYESERLLRVVHRIARLAIDMPLP